MPLLRKTRSFRQNMWRKVDDIDAFFREGAAGHYPHTSAALVDLKRAVANEMPRSKKFKARPSVAARKHYLRWWRLKRENDSLQSKLASHTAAKADGNRLSPEWILRIFLTSPSTSSRSLARSFRDVVGLDENTVGKDAIHRVRGAWVESYKATVMKLAAERVAGALGAARCSRAAFAPIFLVHVQDEADIRLRSREDDGLPVPRRSRASKVQQNVVDLVTISGSLNIPTELEALGDKTSATLATSFERLVRHIAAGVLPATGGIAQPQAAANHTPEAWLIHVLVGDGVPTNYAAARRLWACLQDRGLGPRTRYLLLVIVCGTHQVGLAAKGAVAGRAAAAARGLLHQDICGVTVRLFKYLINDYYDEFVFSVREWVRRDLEVLQPHEADAAGQASLLSWLG
jgi:hypothetical protein